MLIKISTDKHLLTGNNLFIRNGENDDFDVYIKKYLTDIYEEK